MIRKFVTILSLSILMGACNNQESVRGIELERIVQDEIEKGKLFDEIDLLKLTDFSWEKAYLFPPYTPNDELNEKLGFSYNDKSNIAGRDDIMLLVFVEGKKAVRYVEITGTSGEVEIASGDVLTTSQPKLLISQTKSSRAKGLTFVVESSKLTLLNEESKRIQKIDEKYTKVLTAINEGLIQDIKIIESVQLEHDSTSKITNIKSITIHTLINDSKINEQKLAEEIGSKLSKILKNKNINIPEIKIFNEEGGEIN